MRRFLLCLSLPLVLFTTSALAQTLPPGHPHIGPRLPSIELSAQASRSVTNDLARASAYVEMTDGNPAELAKKVNARIADTLALARGYSAVKVRSSGTYTYPVYGKTGRTIESWRMRSEIAMESRDIAAVSELVGKIQTLAAVSQLNVEASPETWKKAEDEAMVEAIRAFQARAAIAAQTVGKRYRIGHINVGGVDARPAPMMKTMRSSVAMEAAPAPVEAGESTVTVTVTGSVELLD